MDINPIVLSIPVFFGLIVIEWVYDWISKGSSYRANDAFGNISCGIFEQSTGLLVSVLTVGLYSITYEYFHIWNLEQNFINGVLLFLGVDFLYYWAHRMSHEVNLFWIGHVVHHQSEEYNLSVALRQGALQKIFTSPFYLPMAIIGFSPEWFLYILAWNTLYQFWIHTEKIDKLGPLEWILNTPSHHRVHHGRDPKYIDKNHAATLIIWDKIFGTFQAEEEHPHYGITKPVNSFNPIDAHFKPISDLWDEARDLTVRERIQLLLAPPGWAPKRLGGRQYAPEVREESKYTVSLSFTQRLALIAAFIVQIGFVSIVLFGAKSLTLLPLISAVLIISINIGTLGTRANGRNPNLIVEALGLLATPIFTFWFTHNSILVFGLIIAILVCYIPFYRKSQNTAHVV
ncbi:MAG: fatty acid hydroxylase family protein [Bacteroidetes bacterium]|nr:MAG: fatty acid hydroxylase family protein [Bacteroidota bacterium]